MCLLCFCSLNPNEIPVYPRTLTALSYEKKKLKKKKYNIIVNFEKMKNEKEFYFVFVRSCRIDL